jgi:hypothetical protein
MSRAIETAILQHLAHGPVAARTLVDLVVRETLTDWLMVKSVLVRMVEQGTLRSISRGGCDETLCLRGGR